MNITNSDLSFEEDVWSSISIDSSTNVDKEFNIINGRSNILLRKEQQEITIGYIRFNIFNSYLLSNYELLDAADALSGDEHWLMSTFLELFEDEFEISFPIFLMLNTITIQPEYRNRGYGKKAIKELIQLCEILMVDYIVLKPSPIEDIDFGEEYKEGRKVEINKLVSFYEQLKFNTYILEDCEPIMVFEHEME